MLTESLRQPIGAQRFGYVANVSPDGAPNLSPKGTFLAPDDAIIAVAEICSPSTPRRRGAT